MLPKCHSATKQKPLSPKYRTKQLMIRTIESTHSSPQAILQADHPGKTSEDRVSQSVLNREGDRTQPPASVIPWDSLPTPHLPFFSFKNCHGWAESLELVSGHESTFSPDCWLFRLKWLSFLLHLPLELLVYKHRAAKPGFSYNSIENVTSVILKAIFY